MKTTSFMFPRFSLGLTFLFFIFCSSSVWANNISNGDFETSGSWTSTTSGDIQNKGPRQVTTTGPPSNNFMRLGEEGNMKGRRFSSISQVFNCGDNDNFFCEVTFMAAFSQDNPNDAATVTLKNSVGSVTYPLVVSPGFDSYTITLLSCKEETEIIFALTTTNPNVASVLSIDNVVSACSMNDNQSQVFNAPVAEPMAPASPETTEVPMGIVDGAFRGVGGSWEVASEGGINETPPRVTGEQLKLGNMSVEIDGMTTNFDGHPKSKVSQTFDCGDLGGHCVIELDAMFSQNDDAVAVAEIGSNTFLIPQNTATETYKIFSFDCGEQTLTFWLFTNTGTKTTSSLMIDNVTSACEPTQPTGSDVLMPSSINLPNISATFVSNLPADCNGNGTQDWEDIASGLAQDSNSNGIPDSCLLDIPTLSEWGIILLALLLLSLATVFVTRLQPATSSNARSVQLPLFDLQTFKKLSLLYYLPLCFLVLVLIYGLYGELLKIDVAGTMLCAAVVMFLWQYLERFRV